MINMVPLSEVAEVNPRVPKEVSTKLDQKVSFVPMASVTENGRLFNGETRLLKDVIRGYTYFQSGDVLLAKITPCFENGKAALVSGLSHNVGFGSTEFHVLRPRKDLDARYLFYQVWSPAFRFVGEKKMTGTAGQKRVPVDFIKKHKIPLPPLEEQKRIAAILDKADAIRRKRQQAIKLADDSIRAIFLDMFGDPVTNPKGWDRTSLGSLIKVKSGNFLPANRMRKGEIPVYGGNGINGFHDEYLLESPVLVIGRVGVYCGAVHRTEGKAWITDNALYVAEKRDVVTDLYLEWALRLANLNQYASQAGQPLISGGRIYPVEINLPPMRLQESFEKVHISQAKMKEKISQSSSIEASLFNSLTQRVVRGEL